VTPTPEPGVGAKSLELHRSSIVVDSMGPPGPSVFTPDMLERLDELASSGISSAEAILDMEHLTDQQVLRGDLPGFWEGWEESGVDVSSVTIGAFGPRSFTYENAIRDISRWTRKFDAVDRFLKVTDADGIERAHAERRQGIILNFQNTDHFGGDLDTLAEFSDLGVRIIQLTYNARNLVGDGCTERNPSGLSNYGLQVVKAMNELGILIDVSHCSHPTAFDAIEASEKPIAITHGFARELNPHDRGASDDLLRAVGDRGYVGIVCVPFFLTSDPDCTLDHFIRHVDHVSGLIGADHVGIGTDWAPPVPPRLQEMLTIEVQRIGFRPEHRVDWSATIKDLDRYVDYPNITRALVEHGYTDDEVRGFLGGNFLRIFREVVG
jgi:membrane dipeptidase